MTRSDGRAFNELRPINMIPGFQLYAEGSILIEMGNTKVVCAATIEDKVPLFLRSSGNGWITAEYSMLPRSASNRIQRSHVAKPRGRDSEIQRLIGRSLRTAVDLTSLGERTIILDCDVLQADGGTRTASITGAYVALYQALLGLVRTGRLASLPIRSRIAATSVGIVDGMKLLDMCYEEDSLAEVDFNVVMTNEGELVEVQGTAEGSPFSQETLDELINLARVGIEYLLEVQEDTIRLL